MPILERKVARSQKEVGACRNALDLSGIGAITDALDRKYKLLFDQSYDGLIIGKLDGNIFEVNQAFVECSVITTMSFSSSTVQTT